MACPLRQLSWVNCTAFRHALKPSALDGHRGIGRSARFSENDEQQKQGRRGDQQQVVIHMSDDLRLLRDQVERRPAGRGERVHELRDTGIFEGAIDWGNRCGNIRMIDLVVGGQERAVAAIVPTPRGPMTRSAVKTG